MTTRKQYSKEFKLDAISLVLEQGYSRAEAARSLEINANMLGRWLREHEAMIAAEKEIAKGSCDSYGSRRMKRALNALGHPIGRRRAWSLRHNRTLSNDYESAIVEMKKTA